MRWDSIKKPRGGSEREVKRFLLFPKTLRVNPETTTSYIKQTRWLEFAVIHQMYIKRIGYWQDQYFV